MASLNLRRLGDSFATDFAVPARDDFQAHTASMVLMKRRTALFFDKSWREYEINRYTGVE
jgi:hypothetical protein